MQEWQEKTRVGDSLLMSGCLLHPDAEDGSEKVKSATKERSCAELRFASFPSPLCRAERAVKGRDERPAGALDSPLSHLWRSVVIFS